MGILLVKGCGVLLGAGLNEIAVERELTDERIDLAEMQRQLRTVFQVAAHEMVFRRACFQGHGAGVLRGRYAILLGHREHAQDAAHRDFPVIAMQALAECARCGCPPFRNGQGVAVWTKVSWKDDLRL
jgi:hypothetical protein